MRTTATVIVMAMAMSILMPLPLADGSWGAAGTFEPDTSFDNSSGRMFPQPDVTAGKAVQKVYFDAFNTIAPTALNPNFATLGTRLHSVGQTRFHAILGVWKDCNRDGYIGSGDNAAREYRAELLFDRGVCPPTHDVPAFNDGQWVVELLPLSNPDPCGWQQPLPQGCPRRNPADRFALDANGTFVWGDLGAPGEAGAGGECRILPMPAGTTASTGGLAAFADCFANHRVGQLVNDAAGTVDPEDGLGLRFEDARHPEESTSALNQQLPVNLFGNPTTGKSGLLEQDSGDSAFSVWDCAPGSGQSPENRTLNPTLDSPTGSYWDGLVATQEGTMGDCDPTTNNALRGAHPLLARESGDSVDPNHRTRNNAVFRYYATERGNPQPEADSIFGRNAPDDYGVGALRIRDPIASGRSLGPEWIADESFVATPPLIRSDAAPDGARYYTFYAYLTTATIAKHNLRLPNAQLAAYGTEMCGSSIGIGALDANGWSCDPTAWWPAGGPERFDGTPLGQKVGAPYQLRDVDCIDGQTALVPTEGACA